MATATQARQKPRYVHDESWALKLPEGKHFGSVTGVQVTPDGHIWVLHIASILEWGPEAGRDAAKRLPSVCEFDADGNFVQGWGGPDWLPREDGLQQWPKQEETIAFDAEGTVWVFGANTEYDHAFQRFSRDGKLLLRVGKFGEKGNDNSPDRVGCPTDAWHDVERREVYVTDGYTNHRVVVFDADSGAFVRAWGAYGEKPRAAGEGKARETFNNPVHAISRGPEGHLYVCDRKNDRVQVFDAVGREEPRFVREIELNRKSPFGTCFNLAFTPDGRFMVINDGNNSNLDVVDVAAWDYVDRFRAPNSEGVGLEGTVHKITADARGDLLLARTSEGIIRLRYEGVEAA